MKSFTFVSKDRFSPKGWTHDAYIDDMDVVRWPSNDRVPPEDIRKQMLTDGLITQACFDKSAAAYEAETAQFLREYIKARRNRTAEQRAEEAFELRAAFGPGETIVNVFTGERTRT